MLVIAPKSTGDRVKGVTDVTKRSVKWLEEIRVNWLDLKLYERFEYVVAMIVSLVIVAIVAVALIQLVMHVGNRLISGALDPLDHANFQAVFGMILTLFIAMEFRHSIISVLERRGHIVQVRTVILIALLAVARKFIVLDAKESEPGMLAALAFVTLSLGVVYWLLKCNSAFAEAPQKNNRQEVDRNQ